MTQTVAAKLHEALYGFPTRTLEALHRIAKDPKKGVSPFFSNPHHMIALRTELGRRNDRGIPDKITEPGQRAVPS